MSDRFRDALKSAWRKIEEQEWIYGTLGRKNSDGTFTFVVPGRPTFVFVTIRNATGAQTVVPARNDAGVPHSPRLPVRMKLEHGNYVIYAKSGAQGLANLPAQDPYGLVQHSTSHKHGGTDEVGTATPGANAVIKADADGKLGAGWLDPADLAKSFLDLTDTPAAYTGETGKVVKVNATEDGLIFAVDSGDVGGEINGAAADTPLDADKFVFWDVVDTVVKSITWANIKATLKTYFDTLYVALTGAQTIAGIKTFSDNLIAKHFRGQYSGAVDFAFYSGSNVEVLANAYWDGTNYKRFVSGKASKIITTSDGRFRVQTTDTSLGADVNITDFLTRFEITAAGIVAIGGVTPSASTVLDVGGVARVRQHIYASRNADALTNYLFMVSRGAAEASSYSNPLGNGAGEISADGLAGLILGTRDATPLVFGTNNVERMRLNSAGVLAFGTIDIEAWSTLYPAIALGGSSGIMASSTTNGLYILEAMYYDGAFKRKNATNAPLLIAMTNSGIIFYADATGAADSTVSATARFAILPTGRVGIGTVTPQGKLHIHDGTSGWLKETKTGVNATPQTVLPSGTIVRGAIIALIANDGTNVGNRDAVFVLPGANTTVIAGTTTATLAISAGGTVTVQRTAGAGTLAVTIDMFWQ